MSVSIYLKETGIIISNRSTGPNTSLDHLPDEYGYVQGAYEPQKFKWNGSKVVPIEEDSYASGTNEQLVRERRNELLLKSDWTQMPDSPLTNAKKAEWATYRQSLRDFMASYTDSEDNSLENIIFPSPPE